VLYNDVIWAFGNVLQSFIVNLITVRYGILFASCLVYIPY